MAFVVSFRRCRWQLARSDGTPFGGNDRNVKPGQDLLYVIFYFIFPFIFSVSKIYQAHFRRSAAHTHTHTRKTGKSHSSRGLPPSPMSHILRHEHRLCLLRFLTTSALHRRSTKSKSEIFGTMFLTVKVTPSKHAIRRKEEMRAC